MTSATSARPSVGAFPYIYRKTSNTLPFTKREEILDWVRRVIISGSTEYRRYQAAASKQRYAIRFPGVTYGGGSLSPRTRAPAANANQNMAEELDDPDLLSGVVDAPPRLAMEMADLIRFKTSTLTAIGLQRNGVWGAEENRLSKDRTSRLMFGALAASPSGIIKGRGVPLSHLSFGLLIFRVSGTGICNGASNGVASTRSGKKTC